jgi:hypothetical protein
MMRYGLGRCRFIKKHREALSVNQIVPAGFVVGVFALLAVCLRFVVLGRGAQAFYVLSLVYCLYVLVILAESTRIAAIRGWHYMSTLPLIFLAIHFGLGLGFIRGTMTVPIKSAACL